MAKKTALQPVINQIVIKAPGRGINDIGKWRSAIQSADSGRPKALFDLYEDLLLDGVLHDACDKRILAVTNAELTFRDEKGNDVPEMTDIIDSIGFEELEKIILKSKFWGRSAAEFDIASDLFNVHEIPPKHINLDKKVILINEADETGIGYETDRRLLVFSAGKRDMGLFIRTAPLVIYKRGGFGDYAQWLEIFGMPQRIGKYSGFDQESRRLLVDALEKAGSAPYVVIPKESDVETVENTGNGSSGISYNDFRKACNEELLITVLGQTLTTVQGENGARSLGEVHRAVEDAKHQSDMRYVQRTLNTLVLPVLESAGFPVAGGKFVFPKSAEPLSVADLVQLSNIIRIPARFVHEKYAIPVPEDDEEIARAESAEAFPIEDAAEAEPPKQKLSDRAKSFFACAPAKATGAIGNFTTKLIDNITGTINLAEKGEKPFRINIAPLFEKALREIYQGTGKERHVNRYLFEISNNAFLQGVSREFKGAGMEFGRKNQSFINEFKYNTAVFSAFKNHRQTEEIVGLLTDPDGNLRPYSEFRKQALEVSRDYNKNWLRTEYNTAVRAARQAVNYRKFLETKRLYPNLEYIKSTAAHPREKHLDWVGTILPIEHPWWDDHMPPSDWNCRCSVRQTDKPETPVPEGDSLPVFRNNPGKTAEPVNIKETAYYKHTDDKKAVLMEASRLVQRESQNWAKENLKGKNVKHKELKNKINFSMHGVKEYLNQPHEFYDIKNMMLKDIKNILKNSEYKGVTHHKGRMSHIFEIEIKEKKNYLIANENDNGEIFLYSITDSDKILSGIKK